MCECGAMRDERPADAVGGGGTARTPWHAQSGYKYTPSWISAQRIVAIHGCEAAIGRNGIVIGVGGLIHVEYVWNVWVG